MFDKHYDIFEKTSPIGQKIGNIYGYSTIIRCFDFNHYVFDIGHF